MAYLVDTDILIDFLRQKDGVAEPVHGAVEYQISVFDLIAGILQRAGYLDVSALLVIDDRESRALIQARVGAA